MDGPSRSVDELWSALGPEDLAFVENIDYQRLALERKRLPEKRRNILTSPTYSVRNRFRMWEGVVYRMENGWSPSGYYLIDEYLNDLISRSNLSEIVDSAPRETREKMRNTLDVLDGRFFSQTVEDRGIELGRWRSAKPREIDSFLWERRPRVIPWDH